jgi:MFS family permease
VLVFPSLIFPYVDALTGTIYSFALFALAFIARPIGTFIFMAVDRNLGRGVKLTIALFLLGGSTMAIAFLPGYAQIGTSAAVLLASSASCRAWRWAGHGTACRRSCRSTRPSVVAAGMR